MPPISLGIGLSLSMQGRGGRRFGAHSPAGYLLGNEPSGFAVDFVAMDCLARSGPSPYSGDPNGKLTYTAPSTKWITNRHGLLASGTTLRCDHDASTLDTSATTHDSLGVGNGGVVRKTLTTTGTVTYAVGDDVVASDAADISKWMAGTVVSYSAGTLVVDFRAASGYFACSSWKTIVARGLRVEQQSTNQVRNSAGTGGSAPTLPTNWGTSSAVATGITVSFVQVVTESGVDCVDIRFQGTANGIAGRLSFDGSNVTAAAVSQIWTGSFFAKLLANPGANLPTIQSEIREFTSGSAGSISPVTRVLTSVLARYNQTYTLIDAGTTHIQNPIRFGYTNAVSYDFTIRIGWPQFEQLGLASSPIRTTSAAVTRAVDNISLALAGGAAGTLFGSYRRLPFVSGVTSRVVDLHDGTSANRITAAAGTSGPVMQITAASVSQVDAAVAGFPDTSGGVSLNFAQGYTLNNSRAAVKGTLSALDTACTIPATTTLHIGSARGLANYLNGHIKTLGYVPRRMIDADLQLRAPA